MYLHYCIQKLHWTPQQWLDMEENRSHKAFVIASIRAKQEAEEKAAKKAKSKRKGGRK